MEKVAEFIDLGMKIAFEIKDEMIETGAAGKTGNVTAKVRKLNKKPVDTISFGKLATLTAGVDHNAISSVHIHGHLRVQGALHLLVIYNLKSVENIMPSTSVVFTLHP